MRDWNREYPRDTAMPKEVYDEVIHIVRAYDYTRRQYVDAVEGGTPSADGMPRGSNISDPTSTRAIRAERFKEKLDAIEQSIEVVPEDVRRVVWENCIHKVPMPYVSHTMYGKWKQRFLYCVAKRLYLL